MKLVCYKKASTFCLCDVWFCKVVSFRCVTVLCHPGNIETNHNLSPSYKSRNNLLRWVCHLSSLLSFLKATSTGGKQHLLFTSLKLFDSFSYLLMFSYSFSYPTVYISTAEWLFYSSLNQLTGNALPPSLSVPAFCLVLQHYFGSICKCDALPVSTRGKDTPPKHWHPEHQGEHRGRVQQSGAWGMCVCVFVVRYQPVSICTLMQRIGY